MIGSVVFLQIWGSKCVSSKMKKEFIIWLSDLWAQSGKCILKNSKFKITFNCGWQNCLVNYSHKIVFYFSAESFKAKLCNWVTCRMLIKSRGSQQKLLRVTFISHWMRRKVWLFFFLHMFSFGRKTWTCLFLKKMSVRNDLECNIVGFCLFVCSMLILLEYHCSVSREHTEKLGEEQ